MEKLQTMLAAQQAFFDSGATRPVAKRRELLEKLKRVVVLAQGEFEQALRDDLGMPESEMLSSELGYVLRDITRALQAVPRSIRPERVASPKILWPARSEVVQEPYGPVLTISSWSAPLQIALTPAIAALAAGNTVVAKPSECAPRTAEVVQRVVNDTFAPEHFTVVCGDGNVAAALARLPFSYVFFTGSTSVGRQVYQAAAANLCPVTLEMGGKNPCVVLADANLKVAARRIVHGKFHNAGQTCVAPDTVFVHQSVKEPLLVEIEAVLDQFYGAEPARSQDFGRIVNADHFERLEGLLRGATVRRGGEVNRDQRYISPTVLDGVEPGSPLATEEIFGPILPVVGFESSEDLDAALRQALTPLVLYVFTDRRASAEELTIKHRVGGLVINDTMTQVMNPELPLGGVGTSGVGSFRGRDSWRVFTRSMPVLERSTKVDLPLLYPPHSPQALAAMRRRVK